MRAGSKAIPTGPGVFRGARNINFNEKKRDNRWTCLIFTLDLHDLHPGPGFPHNFHAWRRFSPYGLENKMREFIVDLLYRDVVLVDSD